MASHKAYLPFVSSPVARKRYTSPTTAMVRPSPGFADGGWRHVRLPHSSLVRIAYFIGCFWKNSHIRSLAETFMADLPMKPTGGCWPGQV